jgi:hypothetical protein
MSLGDASAYINECDNVIVTGQAKARDLCGQDHDCCIESRLLSDFQRLQLPAPTAECVQ